ncbi:MAG: hypothetical protein D8M59_13245 [Planctomycetes bacterium]|nr:hypothetical protein [Planctomycetota bacterium]NOG54967.1 hypothetical protein [Planctomycetota bacterium]
MPITIFGLTVAAATTTLAQDGLPYDIEAPDLDNVWWASAMSSGWDVNHDGCDDLFLVDALHENDLGEPVGEWSMYSGADGSLLWVTEGPLINSQVHGKYEQGMYGTFVGDVNEDDVPDLIIGTPAALDARGYVAIISGANGNIIRVWEGQAPYQLLGRDVAYAGDVNNDGVADFAYISVVAPEDEGRVIIRSGADFAVLHEWSVSYPRRIRWAGDINNDNYDDIAIGSYMSGWEPSRKNVLVYSGKPNQGVILELQQPDFEQDYDFGYALAAGADVTGDGTSDFAVVGWLSTRVYLFSGADGDPLISYTHDAPKPSFGKYLRFADMNADGRPELVIGSTHLIEVFEPLSGTLIYSLPSHPALVRYQFGNEQTVGDFNGDGCADVIPDHVATLEPIAIALWGGGRLLLSTPCMDEAYFGNSCDFNVYGDLPGRTVHLFASNSGCDCTYVNRLGICIDLDTPMRHKGSAVTDSDRWARIEVNSRDEAKSGYRWLQAIDPSHPVHGPIKSNVWRVWVE